MPVVLAFVVVVLKLFEFLVKLSRACFSAPAHFLPALIAFFYHIDVKYVGRKVKIPDSDDSPYFSSLLCDGRGCDHNIARRSEMSKLQRKQFLVPDFIFTDQIAVFNSHKPSLKLDGLAVQILPKSVKPFSTFCQTNARRFIFIYNMPIRLLH